jgi:hypothetical protein
MASIMELNSKQHLAMMLAQMQINVGKINKVKIKNLKITKDLGVIGEEKFTTKIKDILTL